ncbi:MAG: SMEK domain-containing protein [Bacteroidia bacterium]
MNDKSIYIEQIVVLLKRYQSDLIANGEFNLLNSHIHAEYFLKQLLNHVCPTWKLKHTAEKFSHNTSSIDLFSEEQGLVVQVTAQKTNHREKIEGTIKKYNADWKAKFPRLRIFFIKQASDELVKEFETEKIKILSFNNIIARIQSKFTVEEVYNLLEFIKQELGTTYGSPYTYERVDLFEEYKKGREHDVISNTTHYKNNLLFYSPTDIARIEKLKTALSQSKSAKALLEGPPCVGKTTLTFELANQISNELIKTFYIDLTGYANNDTGIKKDIDRISPVGAKLSDRSLGERA